MTSASPHAPLDGPRPCPDPPSGALAWAAGLLGAGPGAGAGAGTAARVVARLSGDSHAVTHLLAGADGSRHAVLRRFPPGDDSAAREEGVLAALDGLDGFAPRLLGADPYGERCGAPAVLITRLPGRADITPADPALAAAALGRALARLHAAPAARLAGFREGMAASRGSHGPAVPVLEPHAGRLAAQPRVLAHFDYWSGNVLWEGGTLTGVVDWSAAGLAPRGFDVGWCRLDLALLHGPDTAAADAFTAAYRHSAGPSPLDSPLDVALWDLHACARSHRTVETWVPNYAGLDRADLTARELRRRHTAWTRRCLTAAGTAA